MRKGQNDENREGEMEVKNSGTQAQNPKNVPERRVKVLEKIYDRKI